MSYLTLYSWNVNGIRAVLRKGALQQFLLEYDPDILCLQETKANKSQVEVDFAGYHEYWNSADRAGYSGTAIFSKQPALKVVNNIPDDIAEQYHLQDGYGHTNTEGRVLVAEYQDYFVATVYTPNAKADLTRLPMRHNNWDPAFLEYMKRLEKTKPVLFCGDFNVAHTEMDLANPKANKGEHGFTDEEREGFDKMKEVGFVDTFRLFMEGNGHYSWWSNFGGARARNVGWRIDYWMVSETLKSRVLKSQIHAQVMGSDHCPVSIELKI
jgi:exodeoxyribonuclease III